MSSRALTPRPQLREAMPSTKEYREARTCDTCGIVGRSCMGVGCGPMKCLKAHGWHRSVKKSWYCPPCRQEHVDSEDWYPDLRALQKEVQCAREQHEAWTCSACDAPNWSWRAQCRRCNMPRAEVPVPECGGVELPVPEDEL